MLSVKWRPFSHFLAWMYNCILKLTPSSFKSVAAPANSGFSVLQNEHPECKKKTNKGPFNQHWLIKVKTWTSNYIYSFLWNVITHPCPNFDGSLTKPLLSYGMNN